MCIQDTARAFRTPQRRIRPVCIQERGPSRAPAAAPTAAHRRPPPTTHHRLRPTDSTSRPWQPNAPRARARKLITPIPWRLISAGPGLGLAGRRVTAAVIRNGAHRGMVTYRTSSPTQLLGTGKTPSASAAYTDPLRTPMLCHVLCGRLELDLRDGASEIDPAK